MKPIPAFNSDTGEIMFTEAETRFLDMCSFVDEQAPKWYMNWCERNGSFEELVRKHKELKKQK